jgi:succinate dehydrogenase/fumarate reductase flavoprotein subunit
MRRLFASTGLPVGAGMEEALRRMEAGEDPEKIEEEMGDTMEDPFGMGGGEDGPREPRVSLSSLRRRVLPPTIDPELHEL